MQPKPSKSFGKWFGETLLQKGFSKNKKDKLQKTKALTALSMSKSNQGSGRRTAIPCGMLLTIAILLSGCSAQRSVQPLDAKTRDVLRERIIEIEVAQLYNTRKNVRRIDRFWPTGIPDIDEIALRAKKAESEVVVVLSKAEASPPDEMLLTHWVRSLLSECSRHDIPCHIYCAKGHVRGLPISDGEAPEDLNLYDHIYSDVTSWYSKAPE